ncbi:hypothetical protein ONE63_008296 [Megalurothrips usitatus]|uniref:Uncharacterized protein n=1 Tax=Megalurothrips usitatus TaxID=439358 RepID=A0AAV7XM17_9NEOP|nr:hypothetical protein ONE63_008296 [Megalurothrips usitatus]
MEIRKRYDPDSAVFSLQTLLIFVFGGRTARGARGDPAETDVSVVFSVGRRYASDLASYGPASAYGHGGGPYAPYGAAAAGAGGSSDDCYVSDASDEYGDTGATTTTATATPAPRRDAVVDGFTDADLMYAQLASSLYGDAYGYGYCGGSGSGGGMDCSRFQLTNYGHLKIDYSCSWRSLDHYIAHS